jgi:DNA-directed RNA polymerase subunit RPC12/RpoP
MKTTTVSYTCDLCGAKDHMGYAEWDRQQMRLKLDDRSDWGKPARDMDLCGECWREVIRVMQARRKP